MIECVLDRAAIAALERNQIVDGVRAVTLDGVGLVQNQMRQSPATGRTYGNHRASAPGEAPAPDTGRLVGAIVAGPVTQDKGDVVGSIRANTEYAAALQLGTEKMAPRPYLDVALDRNKDRLMSVFRAGAKL